MAKKIRTKSRNLGKIVRFAIRTKPGTALIESALSEDPLYYIFVAQVDLDLDTSNLKVWKKLHFSKEIRTLKFDDFVNPEPLELK